MRKYSRPALPLLDIGDLEIPASQQLHSLRGQLYFVLPCAIPVIGPAADNGKCHPIEMGKPREVFFIPRCPVKVDYRFHSTPIFLRIVLPQYVTFREFSCCREYGSIFKSRVPNSTAMFCWRAANRRQRRAGGATMPR